MTIAVHLGESENYHSVFLFKCFEVLIKKYPHHKYIFFTTAGNAMFPGEANCTTYKISPPIRNNILLHYWYNWKLPVLLKKCNADVFINEDAVASLKTRVRQIMVLRNFHNIEFCIGEKSSLYARRFFKDFMAKTSSVLCTSGYIAGEVEKHFPGAPVEISTIGFGLSEAYKPLSYGDKDIIQNKVSGGHAYFFAEVTPDTKKSVLVMLKAFSIFKKWHKSSMKFVLVYKDELPAEPVENFNLYKYRGDVILVPFATVDQLAETMGAAYAVIYLPSAYTAGFPGFHALKSGVPLIAADTAHCNSHFSDAALYVKPAEKDLSEKMARLYKDETLCKINIAKGIEHTRSFTWENTAGILWNEMCAQ